MHGPTGALEKCMHCRLLETRAFPKDICVLYKMVNFNDFLDHSDSKSSLKM